MCKKEKSLQIGPRHKGPHKQRRGGELLPKMFLKSLYDYKSFFFFNIVIINRFYIFFPASKKDPKLNIETIEVQPN